MVFVYWGNQIVVEDVEKNACRILIRKPERKRTSLAKWPMEESV
jgi:hypothetical protein